MIRTEEGGASLTDGVLTFQRTHCTQTTRTPVSRRRAQMSQVQELFHEAAQQVGLGVWGSVSKGSPDRKLTGSITVHRFHSFIHSFIHVFCLFKAVPVAYGGSQVRGRIRAIAAGLHHSHSNARSEPRL